MVLVVVVLEVVVVGAAVVAVVGGGVVAVTVVGGNDTAAVGSCSAPPEIHTPKNSTYRAMAPTMTAAIMNHGVRFGGRLGAGSGGNTVVSPSLARVATAASPRRTNGAETEASVGT